MVQYSCYMSIKIDYSNILPNTFLPPKSFSSNSQINSFNFDASKYIEEEHDKAINPAGEKQGFVDLPFDIEIVTEIQSKTLKFQNQYDTIVVLGIGGSMLGVQVLVDSLYIDDKIIVHCLDNIDPFVIENLSQNLDYSQTLFLVQTKSGGTPETIAQFLYFKEQLQSLNLNLEDHCIFVTDPERGYLRQLANQNPKIVTFDIPANVGGRFSILTPMGLLISCLLDLDAQRLLDGAGSIYTSSKELCASLANNQFQLYKQGVDQNVLMPYTSRLATLCKWYIQLLSESTGKEFDLSGNKVNVGITPVPATGATDQHSQVQLFKDGPFNKLIMTIQVENYNAFPMICDDVPVGYEYLKGVTFGQLMDAELQGTRQSLTESGKPNLNIVINKVCEYTVGELLMMFELSVAYLGNMLNINTFDQPGVERGKIVAKEILSTQSA
jgi:glucose-6-phosphate isomerase